MTPMHFLNKARRHLKIRQKKADEWWTFIHDNATKARLATWVSLNMTLFVNLCAKELHNTLSKQRNSQARRRFGYPVLISIDFDDFTSPFALKFLFSLKRYIKHSRQSFIGYPNTSNFVKNTPLRVVFSTLFTVFGYPSETLFLVFDILLQILRWSAATRLYFCLTCLHENVQNRL